MSYGIYSKAAQLKALELRIKYFDSLNVKAELDRLRELREKLK